jgi:hypothetical protein
MEAIQTAKYMPYLFKAAIRQDGQKLITTVSGHDIGSASGSLQPFPECFQYVVSDSMAVFIYLFKVIQVSASRSMDQCR